MAKQGSIAPLLGAVGFVVVLTAAWFAVRPSDTTGLPLPPWIPPTATTAQPGSSLPPPEAPAPSTTAPQEADPEAAAAVGTATDLTLSRMEMDRRKMLASARLGPDFQLKVDALFSQAKADVDALAARVASDNWTEEQAREELDRIRQAFDDDMVAALPPSVVERLGQGHGGRD